MWLKDPKDGKPSVSLTMLIGSASILVILGVLEAIGLVKSTSVFLELTISMIGLYFGRRITFKGQTFGEDKKE